MDHVFRGVDFPNFPSFPTQELSKRAFDVRYDFSSELDFEFFFQYELNLEEYM